MKKAYPVIITILAIALLGYILFSGSASPPDNRLPPSAVTRSQQAASTQWGQQQNTTQQARTYVLNTNTKKFHLPNCPSVNQMKDSNKQFYNGTRQSVLNMGYSPCGRCHP